jgi:hypothetical protein
MSNLTNVVFGKRALHRICSADYIDWADEMLEQDYDTPHLRILAGLDRRNSIVEVEPYFIHSLKELNIEQVEPKAAVQAYACDIAQQIIDGKFTSAREAIKTLYQICVDTNYDPDYRVWLDLDDALDCLHCGDFPYSYPSATLENIDRIIKQEAENWIAGITASAVVTAHPLEPPAWGRWIADRLWSRLNIARSGNESEDA